VTGKQYLSIAPLNKAPVRATKGTVGAGRGCGKITIHRGFQIGEFIMAMYCKGCGTAIVEGTRFCSVCGTPVVQSAPAGYTQGGQRTLVRPRFGRMIGGVCQGLANQYNWDVAWVRVLAVILAVFGGGLGAVAYVVLWIVTPEELLTLPPGPSFTPGS
jgi:phage shock protein C